MRALLSFLLLICACGSGRDVPPSDPNRDGSVRGDGSVDAGAGDSGTADAGLPCRIDSTFASIYSNVLSTTTCVSSPCHGPIGNGGLSFIRSRAEVHALLLGPTENVAGAATMPSRIVPGSPQQSFFFSKIADPAPPGGRMPLGSRLADCEIAAIGAWITGGAPDD